MTIKLKVKSKIHAVQVRKAVQESCAQPLVQCAALVESEAKKSMRKGGKIAGRATGVPSAPGDPPNVQWGVLRGSITYGLTRLLTALAGPTKVAWYGKIHEKGGTFGRKKYPPRPFMLPALHKAKSKFPQFFKKLKLAQTSAGRRLNGLKGKI